MRLIMKKETTAILKAYLCFSVLTIMLMPLALNAEFSGFITEDTTFTTANSPYSIDGDLFIAAGITVTINPGVTFQLKANNDVMGGGDYSTKSEIIVFGTLICEGTADSLIHFKSYFGSNAAGEWGQIMTDLEGSIYIQYTEIKHATRGLNIFDSAPMDIRIENCDFIEISDQAIRITSSNIIKSFISGNTFTSNVNAIYSPSNTTVISNEISSSTGYAIKVGADSYVIDNDIQGISLEGIYLNGNGCSVINNRLVNVNGASNSGSIYTVDYDNHKIYGNIISGGAHDGIFVYGDNNEIKNNLVFNKSYGITIYNGNHNQLNNNTVYSNTRGINITNTGYSTPSDYTNITNNIITNNSTGIDLDGYSSNSYIRNTTLGYNNVWNNTTNYSDITADVNSISVNPYFTNPSINDFTLQAGSPCLVMGENGGQMGAYGGLRENNNSPDYDYIDLNNASNNFFADQSFDVLWTASDLDGDDVSVYLYWDSDTDTTHMTSIDHDLSNSGSYTWNTSRMIPGSYYIHAVAYDYKLGRISKYSAGQVIINHEANSDDSPTNLVAYPANQSISLNWDTPESGTPDHYIIYQSTVSGFYPLEADSIGESATSDLVVSGLTNGTKYFYRVAARGSNGVITGFTNEASSTPRSVTIQVGSESSAPGAEVSIPISISDMSGLGVVAYQFTINFSSEYLVLNSVTTTNCITNSWSNLSVNVSSSSVVIWHSGTEPLSGSGNLLNLEFSVNSNATPGATTEISITDILINEGNPEFNSFDGAYSVFPGFNISGAVDYYMGTHPVDGVSISLSGAESATVITNESGVFNFPAVQGGWSYEIVASNVSILSQAISAYDAALILRHIAQLDTLETDQLIAADVSGDGTASSTDAANIGQWGVGLITDFPSGEAWYFSPEVVSIDPLTQDTSTVNFVGIAYGDVSGNWDNQANRHSEFIFALDSIRSTIVEIQNQYIVSLSEPIVTEIDDNEYIVYDVYSNTTEGILAFTLRFVLDGGDQNNVEFFPSENFADNLCISNYNEDHLIITSAGIYPANTPDQNIGKVFLNRSSSRSWGELVLTSAEINENPAVLGSSLDLEQGGIVNISEFRLYQNYPNPFNASTLIKYDVPTNTKVSLFIYDLKGEQVKSLVDNCDHRAGAYSLTWTGKNDRGADVPSGLYMYRFSSSEYSMTGKLLLLK